MNVKASDREAGTYTVCELIEHMSSIDDAVKPSKHYSKPIRQSLSSSIGSRENDVVIACYAHSGGDVLQRICHLLRVADAGPSKCTQTYTSLCLCVTLTVVVLTLDWGIVDRHAVDSWQHDNAKESAEIEMHLPYRIFRSDKPLAEVNTQHKTHASSYIMIFCCVASG